MSEYQYVAFQAVDRPLDDKQLEFAQRQSSRAEVSRWALTVEYHYSSFRGDVDGLLRRGYDVYLTYTDYGDREIRLRLPHGLPAAKKTWARYIDGERLSWNKDTKGNGGILSLRPYHESGALEEVWDFGRYLDAAVEVRERLMGGDLRALYLLWLCAADDDYNDPDDTVEPPVPHGIGEMPCRSEDLLSFFGLDPLLLKAAATDVGGAPTSDSRGRALQRWVQAIDHPRATQLLHRFLTEDAGAVKADLLAEIRDSQASVDWPCTDTKRTFGELLAKCEGLRQLEDERQQRKAEARAKREAAKAEKERQARMKEMVKAPDKWLGQAEELADARGTANYQAAAEILANLREAVGGDEGDKITRRHAAHLAKKYPTLNHLKSALRKRGLLE